MLKEGMIVGERYEIISRIGSGGMADVYKAKDYKLNRLVAVKVMKAEFSEDRGFIAKFRKEAQAAAGLAHPNVVNVYDVGEDNGVYYIVMELVQGITLKDYITRKGKLTVREATSIAIQVSLGLEAAHRSNIVHRDVKPQNIIISTDGKVKLSDFGIARAASSNTISSNVMGSVHYSSPEQVRGGYSDAKSDIYSMGITMYEMVTGQVPFDGDTTVAIAIKHLQEEMESPRKLVPDLPRSLEQIILKCTQKSVDRRYSNMSEVIDDLKHSLLDPNGSFVSLTPLSSHAQTVMLSPDELDAIREGRTGYAAIRKEEPNQAPYSRKNEEYDEGRDDNAYEKYDRRDRHDKYDRNEKYDKYDNYDDDDDEDDEDDDDGYISSNLEKAMTIGGYVIGAIIVCMLIFFIAKGAGLIKFGDKTKGPDKKQEEELDNLEDLIDENGQVTVPDLRTMTEEYGISILEQLGLKGNKTGEGPSAEYKAGQIMSQEIAPLTKVEQGTVINYQVSTGNGAPVVPRVLGMSQSEAEAKIKALGLETAIQQEYDDTVPIGKIISVTPGEGTELKEGDTVTLVVSLGEENKKVKVPNVLGKDEATAKKMLNDCGIQVNVSTTTTAVNGVGEGCVATQSIAADTEVDPGTVIELQIYHAPNVPSVTPGAETTWRCNVKLSRPGNYTNGPVRIRLVQQVNGQNVETVLLEGQPIDFAADGYPLSAVGAEGVESGIIYLEELVDEQYIERAHYNDVPFRQSQS